MFVLLNTSLRYLSWQYDLGYGFPYHEQAAYILKW